MLKEEEQPQPEALKSGRSQKLANSLITKHLPKAMTLNEVIAYANKQPDTQFIWSGIPRGGVGFVFGQSKSGKTILCENLGMLLAAGQKEFLGQPLLQNKVPPKVLFISLEEHITPRSIRNKKQASILDSKLGEDWRSNYLVVDHNFPRFIDSNESWDIVNKIIEDNTPDIVFIDSLTRLVSEPIEKSTVASKLMRRIHKLANDNNITLIIIHHTTKQSGKPLDTASLAGSRVVTQEADFAIGVNKARGVRYTKDVFFRYKAEEEHNVQTFTINDMLWLKAGDKTTEEQLVQDNDGRIDDTNRINILNFMRDNKAKGEITSKELEAEFIQPDNSIMSKKTLYDSIKVLTEDEKLQRVKKGVYRLL